MYYRTAFTRSLAAEAAVLLIHSEGRATRSRLGFDTSTLGQQEQGIKQATLRWVEERSPPPDPQSPPGCSSPCSRQLSVPEFSQNVSYRTLLCRSEVHF